MSDEELREEVTKLLWGGRTDVDRIMQLIASEKEAAAREAVANELKVILDVADSENRVWAGTIKNRIKQLTQPDKEKSDE